MTLNTVTLTWDLADLLQDGIRATLSLTPNAVLTDATNHLTIPEVQRSAQFVNGTGSLAGIIACDNGTILPSGWAYTLTVSVLGQGQLLKETVQIDFSNGATQDLSALVPLSPAPGLVGYLPLPSGTPQAGYVPTATGTGEASAWAPSGTGGSGYPASPVVSGTPSTGNVLTATSPTTATWQAPSGGGGGITPPAGDIGGSTGTPTVVSTHLSSALPINQGGTGQGTQQAAIDALAGAVTSGQYLRGNGTHVVLGAIQAGDVPTLNQDTTGKAAKTDALNSATTVVNVSAATAPGSGMVLTATDSTHATWQSPASGFANPMTTKGDIIVEDASPAPARLAGPTSATKQFLTSTGTGSLANIPAWGTIASGDVPTLNQSTTGNAATATNLAGGATLPAYLAPAVSALSFGSTIAVNAALGNVFTVTLASSAGTISNPSNPVSGQPLRFYITQDATGSRTVAWGTAYDFASAGVPTLSTAANAIDIIAFEYVSATSKWRFLGISSPTTLIQLDTVAADILAPGTQAAGSIGKGADAGHVHPASFTFTGYYAPKVVTLTDASTILVDASLGNEFAVTLGASGHTLGNPSNPVDGETARFRIIQDATGSRTMNFGTSYDFGAASAPTLSTAANKVDILGFEYVASISKWCYLGSGLGF